MSATTITPLSSHILASAERVIERIPIAPAPVLIVVCGGQDDTAIFITESETSVQSWLLDLAKGYGSGTEIVTGKTGVVGDSRGYTLGVSFSKQSAVERRSHPRKVNPRLAANIRRMLNAQVRSVLGSEADVALEATQGASHAVVVLLACPLRNHRPSIFLSNFGNKMRRQFSGLKFDRIRAQEVDRVWGVKGWYALE